MVKRAATSGRAMRMANAIEAIGAEVFSVTRDGLWPNVDYELWCRIYTVNQVHLIEKLDQETV